MNKEEEFNTAKKVIIKSLRSAADGFRYIIGNELTANQNETIKMYRQCLNLLREVCDMEYEYKEKEEFKPFEELMEEQRTEEKERVKKEQEQHLEAMKKWNPERYDAAVHLRELSEKRDKAGKKWFESNDDNDYREYKSALEEFEIEFKKYHGIK